MALSPEPNRQKTGREEVETVELVRCLLANFSRISVERLHDLAFLTEYIYFEEHGKRLTPADYEPVLSGCYSKQVQEKLDELTKDKEGVDFYEAKVDGKSIDSIKIQTQLDCESQAEDFIREVAEEYGEVPPAEIDKMLHSLSIYQDTHIGETIIFDR